MSSEPNGSNGVGNKLGLSGLWRDLANFGAVGLICASQWFLLAVEMPRQRQELLNEQRIMREHDERRTAELTKAINDLTAEVRRSRLSGGT